MEAPARVRAAGQLALAATTAEVVDAMAQAGIRTLMLKGPAIATRLYEDPAMRTSGDVDLLVEPCQFPAAAQVLVTLGFHDPLAGARAQEQCAHSATFLPGKRRAACVDLHTSVQWCSHDPELLWAEFSRDTRSIRVHGRSIETLSDPAQAFVIAAHALQHAGAAKPREDLRRAVARYERGTWAQAASMSRRLGADAVLAAGLRLSEGGAVLASQLGLPEADDSVEIRLSRAGAPPVSFGLVRMAGTPSIRRRLVFLLGELFPSRVWMRETYPFAARGRAMLALAYLYRPLWLAVRLPTALTQWRRAARSA